MIFGKFSSYCDQVEGVKLKSGLTENVMNDFAVHIGQAKVASLITISQLLMINSEQMKNGGLQVMHVDGVLHDVHAVVIGLTIAKPGLHPASGQPVGKAIGVMIAPVIGTSQFALAINRTAEFAPPDHKRVFKHAPLLKIGEKSSGGLIGVLALPADVPGGSSMSIPSTMEKLDEAHAPFRQAAGEQAIVGVLAHLPAESGIRQALDTVLEVGRALWEII